METWEKIVGETEALREFCIPVPERFGLVKTSWCKLGFASQGPSKDGAAVTTPEWFCCGRRSRNWSQQALKLPQKCVDSPGMGSCRCSLCPISCHALEPNQSRDVFTELTFISSHCLITTCSTGNLGQNCLLTIGELHVFLRKPPMLVLSNPANWICLLDADASNPSQLIASFPCRL